VQSCLERALQQSPGNAECMAMLAIVQGDANAERLRADAKAGGSHGYFANWFDRVDKTKDEQPHWVTPLATTTPRLEEEYRYDQLWQVNGKGVTTDNYDGGKGLELIPLEKVEVIFNVPPYIAHNNPKVADGWADAAFLVKYRLLSANEQHGNYILTAFLGWSVPTGQYSNGALHAVITPTIAYGKGFGNFDAQGTFGVALPVSASKSRSALPASALLPRQ
jgi:hypothetical protein